MTFLQYVCMYVCIIIITLIVHSWVCYQQYVNTYHLQCFTNLIMESNTYCLGLDETTLTDTYALEKFEVL